MDTGRLTLGEAELEIMKALWKADAPCSVQDISMAVANRGWKRTTIATFLARLAEKGAVKSEKRGNVCYYTPRVSARAYKKAQTRHLIATLFNGSARDLAVSLFEEAELSEQDVRELRALFDDKEG